MVCMVLLRYSTISLSTDPRGKDEAMTNLRSINLAISSRGLESLRSVDPSLGRSAWKDSVDAEPSNSWKKRYLCGGE